MFCRNCGKQLPDYARFCDACGTQVGIVSPDAPSNSPVTPAPDTTQTSPVTPAQDTMQTSPVTQALEDDYNESSEAVEHEVTITESDYEMAMATWGPAPVKYVDDNDNADEGGAFEDVEYVVVHSYVRAVNIAIARGAKEWRRAYEGEEEMECDDCVADTSLGELMKMAEKDDQDNNKRGIKCSYVVSQEGAIGVLVDKDDDNYFEHDLHWLVYTPERTMLYLPMWRYEIERGDVC